MSAAAEKRGGGILGLLLAAVVSLAATTVFVVWRFSAQGSSPESGHSTPASRGADDEAPALSAPSSVQSSNPASTHDRASARESRAASTGSESPAAPRSGRLCRGRFVFVDGEPAASVGFIVESRPSDDAPYVLVGRGLSMSDGSFSLQLFESWQVGRPVRFACSPGERLTIDSMEHALPSDTSLEVAVSGARVTLQVVDSRGAPVPNLKLCYRPLAARDASAEAVLQFGTTDRDGRDFLDFVTPEALVVWAVNADEIDCTDRVELVARHGVRANRTTLIAPRLPLPGGLRVTVVDEFDRPVDRAVAELRRGRRSWLELGRSGKPLVFEQLEPGEYTLLARPRSSDSERNSSARAPHLPARMRVDVSDRVEVVRISLHRAAILMLDVSRTGEWTDVHAYLRVPEKQEAPSHADDEDPSLGRGLSWTRFVDAAGGVWTDGGTSSGLFRQPGRYWCHTPPGKFEVVFVKQGEVVVHEPRGPVELTSERETTLAVEF